MIAIHDLNLAAAYCDSLHVLERGELVASGRTQEVLTPALVSRVFGVDCETSIDASGTLRLAFRPRPGDTDVT